MTTSNQATHPHPTDPEARAATLLGITRLDIVRSPRIVEAAQDLVHQWGRDRALSMTALGCLAALVDAAVAHGLRFDPRAVTIRICWVDPDRVRVELRWHGCSGAAPAPVASGELESTVATLDAYAEQWGFRISNSGPVHWMVIDTR